jgi:hypothetical protein
MGGADQGAAPENAMSNKLATALQTVIGERGMADNLAEAAKKIGVAYLSLKKVLDGAAKPNKATAGKYQAFLGIDNDDFANLLEPKADKPAKAAKAPKAPKQPKPPKVAGTRGRPRRSPAAETEEVATPTTTTYSDTPDSEKDVTRAIAVTTEPSYAHRGTTEPLEWALAALHGVLKDDLALRVHAAPAGVRALIQRMLG